MTNKFRKLYEMYDEFIIKNDISKIIKESSRSQTIYLKSLMKVCTIFLITLMIIRELHPYETTWMGTGRLCFE